MPKKRPTPEQIVTLLRQIEVTMLHADRYRLPAVKQRYRTKLRDELLNGEIFCSLKEAKILIEQWRRHYNTVRPHSSLGYRPPAPQTYMPQPPHLDGTPAMQ